MRLLITIFWAIILLFAIIFCVLNSHIITVNFYAGNFKVYLPLLLLIVMAIGALLGILAVTPRMLRAKMSVRKLKQRVKNAEQEVSNLRAIPIKDNH